MTNGIYKITEDFEKALSDYTGAPHIVTVNEGTYIGIPARRYTR